MERFAGGLLIQAGQPLLGWRLRTAGAGLDSPAQCRIHEDNLFSSVPAAIPGKARQVSDAVKTALCVALRELHCSTVSSSRQ